MMMYNPARWYWIVGGDETRRFHSAVRDYVPSDDVGYRDWLGQGNVPTSIANDVLLNDVLLKAVPSKAFTRSFGVTEIIATMATVDTAIVASHFTAEEIVDPSAVATSDARIAACADEMQFRLGAIA